MKKGWIIAGGIVGTLVLVLIIGIVLLCCVFASGTTATQADIDNAIKEFGVEEVVYIAAGPDSGQFGERPVGPSPSYVLGKKDGKEIFVVVPYYQRMQPFVADCPFAYSFDEILDFVNTALGKEVVSKDLFGKEPRSVGVLRLEYGVGYGNSYESEDVALYFDSATTADGKEYCVVQSNGELRLYSVNGATKEKLA